MLLSCSDEAFASLDTKELSISISSFLLLYVSVVNFLFPQVVKKWLFFSHCSYAGCLSKFDIAKPFQDECMFSLCLLLFFSSKPKKQLKTSQYGETPTAFSQPLVVGCSISVANATKSIQFPPLSPPLNCSALF